MKELSIEEKAKAYDEAIEILKEGFADKEVCGLDKSFLQKLFPELQENKESEDERIRKWLIELVEEVRKANPTNVEYNGMCSEAIVWLEKQREQKPVDKVEPKFKVGDWITDGEKVWKIGYIEDDMYIEHRGTISGGGAIESIDKNYHLWTIQDAKDGDILCSNQIIVLFKQWEDNTDYSFIIAHAGIDVSGKLQVTDGHWLINNKSKPATKEQRDTLFKAMADAGYTFDFKKKELRKIEHNPTWSEEDEYIIEKLFCLLDNEQDNYPQLSCGFLEIQEFKDWLKSLKDRVLPQPKQEWNEEDKYAIQVLKDIVKHSNEIDENIYTVSLKEKLYDWFKSLKNKMQSQNLTVTDEQLAQAKKDAYNDALDKIEYRSGEPTFDDGWSAAIQYLKKRKSSEQQIEAHCDYSEYEDWT